MFAACGSSATTNVTGPTPSKCQVSISNSTSELPSAGGTGTLTVTSERECAWSASTNASWISLAATSGQGASTINYTVQANPNGTTRQGQVTVSDQSVSVAQQAAPCKFAVSPDRMTVDSTQSGVSFSLTSTPGCQWSARSTVDWISGPTPSSGNGNATVRFTVSANAGGARAGSVSIGDAQASISQSAAGAPAPPPPAEPTPPAPPPPPSPGCTFTVSPLSMTVDATGGDVPIVVSGPAPCAWAVANTADWISIRTGTMVGPLTIVATVSPNPGAARTATLSIAEQSVTISQLAKSATPTCTYQLTPASADVTSDAQDLTVAMAAQDGCPWALTSEVPWITISDAGPGTGAGAFRVTIAANSGAARTGVVHAATAALTVNQAASPASLCNYAINPGSYDAARDADAVDVSVTAGLICAWTASSNANWITIGSGIAGLGNGTVHLVIAANVGSARVGTATIAGQPFTVRQPGVCTYTLTANSATVGRGQDSVTVTVNTDTGCAWTASSPVPWVTISQGATGTGPGDVKLAIQSNDGPDRSATLTIAGQPFQLKQKGK